MMLSKKSRTVQTSLATGPSSRASGGRVYIRYKGREAERRRDPGPRSAVATTASRPTMCSCVCPRARPCSPGRGARHARHGLVAPTTSVLVLGSQGGPSLRSCAMTYESLSRPTPLPRVVIQRGAVRHRQGAPTRHNDDIEGMSPQLVVGGASGRCLAVNADWVRGHLLSKLFAVMSLIRPGLTRRGMASATLRARGDFFFSRAPMQLVQFATSACASHGGE